MNREQRIMNSKGEFTPSGRKSSTYKTQRHRTHRKTTQKPQKA